MSCYSLGSSDPGDWCSNCGYTTRSESPLYLNSCRFTGGGPHSQYAYVITTIQGNTVVYEGCADAACSQNCQVVEKVVINECSAQCSGGCSNGACSNGCSSLPGCASEQCFGGVINLVQ